jgi:hypothetical protein
MKLSQIILVSEFDIIVKFVIGGNFCKLKRRPVSEHKRFERIVVEAGDLFYCVSGETVADELILFVFDQPGLECGEASVSFEPEYVDQFIEVQTRTILSICDAQAWFLIIKYLLIILTVLNGIHPIVSGCHAYFR